MVSGTEPAGLAVRTDPGPSTGRDTSNAAGAGELLERLAAIEAGIRADGYRQPPEVVEAIARLRTAGATVSEISGRTGISREIVRDRLRRAGALGYRFREQKRHVQAVLEQHGAEIVAAYLAGATVAALASLAGVHHHTIKRYLVAEGVPIRNPQQRIWEIFLTNGA